MSSPPVTHLTPEKYLDIEERNEFRSEYMNGEMFAMAGETRNHARIVSNSVRRLADQSDRGPCEVAAGDLRVYIPKYQVFTYPNIVVTSGSDQYHNGRRDTIVDAAMIVEVLSASTKNYDRAQNSSIIAPCRRLRNICSSLKMPCTLNFALGCPTEPDFSAISPRLPIQSN